MLRDVSRRDFIRSWAAFILVAKQKPSWFINTVNGSIPVTSLGSSLVHEHFLVDFIGADKINANRWNREDVVKKVLPFMLEVKQLGVKTFFDCTPAFLGRDPLLQQMLAKQSGLQIITNTGYYGAVQNNYLPPWAFTETAEQVAKRWINEFKNGIDGTTVKPGFIKIGVNEGTLSALHQKLIRAAALTHLQTGLTICSHTGKAVPAFEQIAILQKMKVNPSAFVWTHSQAEEDWELHIKAAKTGAWISLDGIGWGDIDKYANAIDKLKRAGLLNRVLISHDAGWYKPGEPGGGEFKGYTNIFTDLFPMLQEKGFTENELQQLLVSNPAEAFGTRVRKM